MLCPILNLLRIYDFLLSKSKLKKNASNQWLVVRNQASKQNHTRFTFLHNMPHVQIWFSFAMPSTIATVFHFSTLSHGDDAHAQTIIFLFI